MLMIKSKIKVLNVEYEKGKAELISAQINTKCGESQKIVVAYIAPKTKTWTKEEHEDFFIYLFIFFFIIIFFLTLKGYWLREK